MSNFNYSSKALSIKPKFNKADCIVFIEGKDDKLFWMYLFNRLNLNPDITSVGGCINLESYIDMIIKEDSKIIVCRDSDYTSFINTQKSHPRIIYTYGYSLENSLYCKENMKNIIEFCIKDKYINQDNLLEWINQFEEKIKPIITFEILNLKLELGKKVIHDITQIIKSKNNPYLDDTKIKNLLENYDIPNREKNIDLIEKSLNTKNKELYYILRGHLLQKAILKFINYEVKMITDSKKSCISENGLYNTSLSLVKSCKLNCVQYNYYKDKINNALYSI